MKRGRGFKIKSQHVARVLDVDFLDSGKPFMVLEYLEGRDLSKILVADGALEPALAVEYVIQALDALASAHALGIIHRDLKPANLFIVPTADGRGQVKVLDFGISKITKPVDPSSSPDVDGGHEPGLTITKTLLGTPHYMSPEQLRSSRNVDARSDIWAVGVILFELLTRRRPFVGQEYGAIFAAILERDPARVDALAPHVPRGLADVVSRCLRRDPNERYPNVGLLAHDLAPFASVGQSSLLIRIDEAMRGAPMTPSPQRSSAPMPPPPSSPSSHDDTVPVTSAAWGAEQPIREDNKAIAKRSRSVFLPIAIVGGVLLLAGSIAIGVWGTRREPTVPATTAAATTTNVTTPSSASASASASPSPDVSIVVAAPSAVPSTAPSASTTKRVVTTRGGHHHPPPPPSVGAAPTLAPTEFDPTAARKP